MQKSGECRRVEGKLMERRNERIRFRAQVERLTVAKRNDILPNRNGRGKWG